MAATCHGRTVARTLEGAVEETPRGIADAGSVVGSAAVAGTVAAARSVGCLAETVTLGDAVGTVGSMIAIEATDGSFVSRIAHTDTFTGCIGAALTATPTRAAELGTRTGLVALLTEVTSFAEGAVRSIPVAACF